MNIAVSACLLGEPCRYDGASKTCDAVRALAAAHQLLPVCPEVWGGLPTPRPPSEIKRDGNDVQVVNACGEDVTEQFCRGARATVAYMEREQCAAAVLKSRSPSCGCGRVYDGTFSGRLVEGWGIAADAIRAAGFLVVDEEHLDALPE